jgi:hypothetical protein
VFEQNAPLISWIKMRPSWTASTAFAIVDQWYDDGEGGGKPGARKKKYTLKSLDPSTLEIVDSHGSARYVKCGAT